MQMTFHTSGMARRRGSWTDECRLRPREAPPPPAPGTRDGGSAWGAHHGTATVKDVATKCESWSATGTTTTTTTNHNSQLHDEAFPNVLHARDGSLQ